MIIEFINYRFTKNGKAPVWLKTDWFHKNMPYISRSGMAKKMSKLVKEIRSPSVGGLLDSVAVTSNSTPLKINHGAGVDLFHLDLIKG